MSELTTWSAARIAEAVRAREVKAEEVAEAHLKRIRTEDPRVRAFVRVLAEDALEMAREVDAKVAEGKDPGRLAGVPIAIKDNMNIRGVETTCSSRILEGYKAPYDATVIERLRLAGAVFLGKTNMDEFAMGSSTENSAFFATKNPWDLERVPGGSSGGSAAAVASRMAPVALGSDTGGSIRQPAAFCGVAGLKPTYGLVSRYGLVAFASSLDQIGPLARTIDDAALVLSVISGFDPLDSTSAPTPARAYKPDPSAIKGLTLGLPKECFSGGVDAETAEAVLAAVKVYESLGAKVREVSLPNSKYAVSTYYLLAPSEASANLARFDGMRYGFSAVREGGDGLSLLEAYEKTRGEGFGPEVKRRIMLGTYALSSGYYDAYYGKAQRVRTLIKRDFDEAFKQVDLLVTPTAPTPPFKLGEKVSDPLQMYLGDVFTIPCNIAGIAGMSVPCGLSRAGLPLGLQLLSRPFEEAALLSAARAYEAARPFPVLAEPA
ncbi:MAG: Asp-tRNA(Asn)/Glu-tRNA(Gln) amidotransferase subunit GatA [Elusimicrobia bacterium]|nr:Asp-tRNA(Asn)/Glu-tRNA(Gln) amidotransferase subunit GatA [Elusimicrobiota bacterium]